MVNPESCARQANALTLRHYSQPLTYYKMCFVVLCVVLGGGGGGPQASPMLGNCSVVDPHPQMFFSAAQFTSLYVGLILASTSQGNNEV